MKPMTPPKITLTIRIEQPGAGAGPARVWERSISEQGAFPGHLAQQELLTIAHAQLHPARKESNPRTD